MEALLNNLKDMDVDVRRAAAERLADCPTEQVIDALTETLSDFNRGVAEAAENALLQMRGERVVKKIIPLLAAEEPKLRNFAFEMLCEIGADSIDDVIALLKDDDKDLRKFGVDILGEVGEFASREAVNALIAVLDDSDVNVGAAAAESLGKIRDFRAIPELVKRLNGDAWMQCSVIKSLSMFNDSRASEEVYKILPFLAGMSLFSAISALGDVGDKSAVTTLLSLLDEEHKAFRGSTISALEKIIQREGEQQLFKLEVGTLKIQELVELLKDNEIQTKLNTITILGWLQKEEAVKPLIDEFVEAERLPTLTKEDVKHNIFKAILTIEPKDITPLTDALQNPATPDEIKAEIIDLLGKLKNDNALDAILEFKTSPNSVLRRVLARTLVAFNHPKSISALLELLKDPEGHTRGCSAESLGKLKVESAVDDLIAAVDDEYDNIAKMVVLALAEIGSYRVIEKFKEILEQSENADKKRMVLFALGKTDNIFAMQLLVKYLNDDDPIMRKITVESISGQYVNSCYDKLTQLLDDDSDDVKIAVINKLAMVNVNNNARLFVNIIKQQDTHLKVKYHIVETLGRMRSELAINTLIELLDDKSAVMTLSAIEALGQIQDDRALEPLSKMCESNNIEIVRAAKSAINNIERGF